MKYLGSKKIETERLELRTQTMNEQKYLWSLLMNEDINRYFLTAPKKIGEKLKDWDIQEKFYEEKISNSNDIRNFEWSIFLKDSNKCIGRITCQSSDSDNDNIRDVGWIIDPIYQNKGYATESAKAMLDYMFNECDIEMIKTSAAIVNKASWKLMEKLGFERQKENIFNQYTYVDGKTECYSYQLSKDKYNKSK